MFAYSGLPSTPLAPPGKVVRQIDPSKGESLEKSAAGYVKRGREYLETLRPDSRFQ